MNSETRIHTDPRLMARKDSDFQHPSPTSHSGLQTCLKHFGFSLNLNLIEESENTQRYQHLTAKFRDNCACFGNAQPQKINCQKHVACTSRSSIWQVLAIKLVLSTTPPCILCRTLGGADSKLHQPPQNKWKLKLNVFLKQKRKNHEEQCASEPFQCRSRNQLT